VQNAATTLTATTKDAGGGTLTGRAVTWQTSDATIASLSATSGGSVQVTGGLTGTATITASSEGQSGTATVTVTAGTATKVRLTLSPSTVKELTQSTATAVVLDGNDQPLQGRTVTWTANGAATIAPATSNTSTGSNSTATATVTAKDVIFTSNASITATVGNRSDSKTLTVQP
jgi:trimeric autotransporter adhesin